MERQDLGSRKRKFVETAISSSTKYKNKLGGYNFRAMAYFWVVAPVLDPRELFKDSDFTQASC